MTRFNSTLCRIAAAAGVSLMLAGCKAEPDFRPPKTDDAVIDGRGGALVEPRGFLLTVWLGHEDGWTTPEWVDVLRGDQLDPTSDDWCEANYGVSCEHELQREVVYEQVVTSNTDLSTNLFALGLTVEDSSLLEVTETRLAQSQVTPGALDALLDRYLDDNAEQIELWKADGFTDILIGSSVEHRLLLDRSYKERKGKATAFVPNVTVDGEHYEQTTEFSLTEYAILSRYRRSLGGTSVGSLSTPALLTRQVVGPAYTSTAFQWQNAGDAVADAP